MKYVVILYSKYTGEATHLGSEFNSREEAISYIATEICLRCNRFEIKAIHDDFVWMNRHQGFQLRRQHA